MESAAQPRKASVLVLESCEQDYVRAQNAIEYNVPGVAVAHVQDRDELMQRVQNEACDIVILDCAWPLERLLDLRFELQNNDYQPSLIVVSASDDSHLIAELNRYRRQRVIVKGNSWLEELAPAVRHELRLRQLEEENVAIKARLTEANQLLNERNRRLDEFSATLAHDIRGPLGGISMKLEYILDNYREPVDARYTDLLRRSLSSCQRLGEIVQAMYEYARLGPAATRMQAVALDDLVSGVVGDMRFDDCPEVEIEIGSLPVVWGNPGLLRRVFSNLISNSVKYNDKARVKVKIERAALIQRGMGTFAEIVVEDNGPGIPEGEVAELFTMFKRGSTSQKDKDGSGIGLAVVQRIVELHYGDISVGPAAKGGARFVFTLPLEDISPFLGKSGH